MKPVKNAFLALEKSAIKLEKGPESVIILEKGFFTKTPSLGVNYKILRSRRGVSLRKRRAVVIYSNSWRVSIIKLGTNLPFISLRSLGSAIFLKNR
jgi:hypothetical protein